MARTRKKALREVSVSMGQGSELARTVERDAATEKLDARVATVDARAATVDVRAATVDVRAATVGALAAPLDARVATLDARVATLDARAAKLDARAAQLDALGIKELRARTGLSQPAFAALLGVELSTLRNWEQGRRLPTGPARALLRAIRNDPQNVIRALASAA